MDGRQHARATRKLIEHRTGRFDADFRMQEQQRLPASAFNQLNADVIDNDGGLWIGGHRLYSAVVMRLWPPFQSCNWAISQLSVRRNP
jgi:hypothetical protein